MENKLEIFDNSIIAMHADQYDVDRDINEIIPIIDEKNELLGVYDTEGEYLSLEMAKSQGILMNYEPTPIDVLQHFNRFETSFIVVINENNLYTGTITKSSLMNVFQNSLLLPDEFSYLQLQTPLSNFSLSNLTMTLESEYISVLHFFTESVSKEDNFILFHLIVNQNNIQHIVDLLELKGYRVLNYQTNESSNNLLQDRYENLMNYLTIK